MELRARTELEEHDVRPLGAPLAGAAVLHGAADVEQHFDHAGTELALPQLVQREALHDSTLIA